MQRPSLFRKKKPDASPYFPEQPITKPLPPKPVALPELETVARYLATRTERHDLKFLKKNKGFALCCQQLVAAKLLRDLHDDEDEALHLALHWLEFDYKPKKPNLEALANLIATLSSPAFTKLLCVKILENIPRALECIPAIEAFKKVDPSCSWLPKVAQHLDARKPSNELLEIARLFNNKDVPPGTHTVIEEVLFAKPKWLSPTSLQLMLDNPAQTPAILKEFINDCLRCQKFILKDKFYNYLSGSLCSYLYMYQHVVNDLKKTDVEDFRFRAVRLMENCGFGEAANFCDRLNVFSEDFEKYYGTRRITRIELLQNSDLSGAIYSIVAMEKTRKLKNRPVNFDELVSCLTALLNSSRDNNPELLNDNTTPGRLLTINEVKELNRTRLGFEEHGKVANAIRLV